MTSPSATGNMGGSSFGPGNTTWGPGSAFRGRTFLNSPRALELERRESYYLCRQHDAKSFDFDGRIIQTSSAGGSYSTQQPLLSAEVAPWYVPLRARRPLSPYRLAKVIVDAFTNMLFGDQRFPDVRVEGDADTQDFIACLVREARLPAKMVRARSIGGSVGTVGLSWCYDANGRPRVEVHNGKNLYVHSWEDREAFVPEHVSELYLYAKDEYDASKKRYVRNWYWYRRDWLPDADVIFQPVLYRQGQDPAFAPDMEKVNKHDDGFAHFAWVQNLPTDDIDGSPDYEGLYESLDAIDLVYSVIMRGATLNLDPTLVLNMDPNIVGGVKKGSDNALVLGQEGDAKYLELAGTSIDAGLKLFDSKRRSALETAQCIIPDPAEIAAQGVSSVALKTIFAPMLSKSDVLREQYGGGLKRILEQMCAVARARVGQRVTVQLPDGSEEERELAVNLPQKVTRVPQLDPDTGAPARDEETGEPLEDVVREDRKPGEGGELSLAWGPYFMPTPDDQSKVLTVLAAAVGGKPVLSQQTAAQIASSVFPGVGADEEWKRVQKMGQDDVAHALAQARAFSDAGDFGGGGGDSGGDGGEGDDKGHHASARFKPGEPPELQLRPKGLKPPRLPGMGGGAAGGKAPGGPGAPPAPGGGAAPPKPKA